MNTLDLCPFVGLDEPVIHGDHLDTVRTAFASTITSFAATCPDRYALLDGLYLATQQAGLTFPRKLGEGSTRTVYALPFGLVLKTLRPSPLTWEECTDRKCRGLLQVVDFRNYTVKRGRTANLRELCFSAMHPAQTPRVYGIDLHSNILISESVPGTLLDLLPDADDDREGLDPENVHFGPDGLELKDRRFNQGEPKGPTMQELFPEMRQGLRLSNIGRTKEGRHVLLDSAGFTVVVPFREIYDALEEQLPIPDQEREAVQVMSYYHRLHVFSSLRLKLREAEDHPQVQQA